MLNPEKISFKGKKVAVVGFGIEGESAVTYLLKQQAEIAVFVEKKFVEDEKKLEQQFAAQSVKFFYGSLKGIEQYDYVVRSPGVHPDKLLTAGVVKERVTTVTNIFLANTPCSVVGVTGTKGKGTTSTLIYEILKKDGRDVYLGGNIGASPLEFLPKLTKDSLVVLEMSSFQLIDCKTSPNVGVILMTVPEHQDWHKDITEYVEAKLNLVRNQNSEDTAVISLDYSLNRSMLPHITSKIICVSTMPHKHSGVFISTRGTITARKNGKETAVLSVKKLGLVGRHNWENAAAAVAAALVYKVKYAAIRNVLASFTGLPYRLELIKELGGVKYYNDSFSTTPETTIAAIKAFKEPKILILGGSTKGSDFAELAKNINNNSSLKAIIAIEPEWQRIKQSIGDLPTNIKIIEGCKNMAEIVAKARELAVLGDIVLLSPGCASFGMFTNYKDRGNQFNQAVLELK